MYIPYPIHFPFISLGFLGPSVDINSNSYNCSTINVTWSDPDVNCGNPVNYNLSIYDDITDQFLWSVAVNGTSYQFEDEYLFRHRYTYVISADNDFSEGISNNDTFSYQRGTYNYADIGTVSKMI